MASIWTEHAPVERKRAALSGDLETDTVVVGGGMAGVLCAFLLQERGVDCVVLEARQIGSGVTGKTTAKITAQHGAIYAQLEKQHGLAAAKEYLTANLEAVSAFRRMTRHIACDFEDKTAYLYTMQPGNVLEQEAAVYRRMGVSPEFLAKPPLPLPARGALGMVNQAQFHPIQFLLGAAANLRIYENTMATEIAPGRVETERGTVRAKNVVLATHYPMINLQGLYFLKLWQEKSYLLALANGPDVGGMYLDASPNGLSFRNYKNFLLMGGKGHRTGQPKDGMNALRTAAAVFCPGGMEAYAWSAQDCTSVDNLPYIGRYSGKNRSIFAATGFRKWGMTGSMAAARVICELITEGGSRFETLFNPSRSMLHPKLFAQIGHAAAGLLSLGKRCPHMGCALRKNPSEGTWECSCHGSRFDKEGNVENNPAKRGIDPS